MFQRLILRLTCHIPENKKKNRTREGAEGGREEFQYGNWGGCTSLSVIVIFITAGEGDEEEEPDQETIFGRVQVHQMTNHTSAAPSSTTLSLSGLGCRCPGQLYYSTTATRQDTIFLRVLLPPPRRLLVAFSLLVGYYYINMNDNVPMSSGLFEMFGVQQKKTLI